MPIGKFKDFKALKGALLSRADKRFKASSGAPRPPPTTDDREAGAPRQDDDFTRAARARVLSRSR